MQHTYVGIIDTNTKALLTVTANRAVGNFLIECTPDTALIPNINRLKIHPRFLTALFVRIHPLFRARSTGDDYVRWIWSGDTTPFVRTPNGIITDDLRIRARLTTARRDAIEFVMRGVSQAREFHVSGVLFQDDVNQEKKIQARRFLETGADESLLMEFPYIAHYADHAGISMSQAAENILFVSRLSDARLSNSELLRWRYFAKIKKVKDPKEFPAILEEFGRDSYMNAMVA